MSFASCPIAEASGNPVGTRTRFHDDTTDRKIRQPRQHLAMRQLLAKNHAVRCVLSVQV